MTARLTPTAMSLMTAMAARGGFAAERDGEVQVRVYTAPGSAPHRTAPGPYPLSDALLLEERGFAERIRGLYHLTEIGRALA